MTTSTLLLVDSGGQYTDGTTDATRTMHFGRPTEEEKRIHGGSEGPHWIGRGGLPREYDRVRAGCVCAEGPVGVWPGLRPRHGPRAGAALNVHEGPISVSPRFGNTNIIKAGMVLSNEPGYYQAGCFGVRIENLLAVEKAEVAKVPDGKAFLKFSYLTPDPHRRELHRSVMMLDAAEGG